MTRYINADAFDERVRVAVGFVEEKLTDDFKKGILTVLVMLKTQPTADARGNWHGEWIHHHNEELRKDYRECSFCHGWLDWDMPRYSYCPYCGARMDGEVASDDRTAG